MSAAQGRIELICRHFAEGGLKTLYSLINNLVIKHQDAQDVFRLNNQFIPVDPRFWDGNKDIVVNVGISKTSDEEKMAALSAIKARLRIEDIANRLTHMTWRGNTGRGKCPLHNGNNATTFVVYTDTQSFYCFNCGVGGDVITLLQNTGMGDG